MLTDPVASLRIDARPVWRQLDAARLLHRYAGHVRSSQQFALNLFGSLTHEGATMLLLPQLGQGWTVQRIDFEFVDHDDTLGEAQGHSTHRTQADVAITAIDERGGRHLVLVEVKLSEDDFGHCSGYEDPANDRIEGCAQPGAFGGGGQATCLKLVNHGKGGTRHYDRFVEVDDSVSPLAGCPFRRSMNQPMRYAALAGALKRTGEWESVTVALCAHDEHRSIWRRWEEAKQVLVGTKTIDLPASKVLAQLPPEDADDLAAQYDIPWQPDDVARLRDATGWSLMVLRRVFGEGGVIAQTDEVLSETPRNQASQPGSRVLAQRLEWLAEAARATRADLISPALSTLERRTERVEAAQDD